MKSRLRIVGAGGFAVALLLTTILVTTARYQSVAQPPAADGRAMVWVPAGRHLIGALAPIAGELRARWLDMPGFAINRERVTTAELEQFISAHPNAPDAKAWKQYADRDHAATATAVPYLLATAYCTDHHANLPTEAQWDLAARGGDGRTFPWGNAPWMVGSTVDTSTYGIAHMVTSGGEWVRAPMSDVDRSTALVRARADTRDEIATINHRVSVGIESAVPPRVGFRCAAFRTASTSSRKRTSTNT